MALYRYVKKPPLHHKVKHHAHHVHGSGKEEKRRRFPLTSAVLMGSGLLIIAWVLWPIASFELFASSQFAETVRPIPDEIVATAFENQIGRLLPESGGIDYTKARNWFPKLPAQTGEQTKEVAYRLSIPKLHIDSANVVIGGDDLDKSLVHYGGTSLPGDYGNAVVFGHSVLPIFFNPKNYLTIFSTLPTLKEGDEIFIDSDNVHYKYVVYNMKVVLPDDVSVLEQQHDWSYLSLITCVPPGTYWKRLVVRARLEKI